MVTNPKLTHAVHFALVSTATAAASMYTPEAISQDAELEQIVVTGSRIRRVDAETASPVFTMDRSTIEASGVTSMGELVQQVPAIAGAATNPAVNNGGGTGASTVELRGLGAERTLVLLNGRRVGAISSVGAVDINMMPVNLIERVEVLKEGAGAVYGSDAIGGVVNFITRTDLDGLEVSADGGWSQYGDGARQAFGVAWGTTGERGSMIVGANYNKQEAVSAGDRKFARDALYLYGGSVSAGGSSRTPNGRIRFNAGDPLRTLYGCSSVTKLPGVPGDSLDDYRCFTGADAYNYQPLNLVMTPAERASVFTSGNFNVTDNTEAYAEWLHGYTTSGYQIAELPFDATQDDVIIPASNVYNPFGIDFGGLGTVNPNAQWRLKSLGTRRSSVNSTTDQITLGLKGKVMDSSWTWDLSGQYAHFDQNLTIKGYLQSAKLQNAFGPNFIDEGGNVVCGTPDTPIPNCIPVNPFDINNPNQRDALKTITASYNQNYGYTSRTAALDFAGDLFKLPAGAVQAAIGFSYNEQNSTFDTDTLTEAQPPDYLNCGLSQETCSGDVKGDFNVKEVYGEIFIPILKDVPAFQALNLTIGTRYSDYDTTGSTTNSSVKLEWRPITDLLVRGSYAEVFRTPQINDLYGAKASTSTTYADPCVGLTPAAIAATPGLDWFCVNVPRDGSFEQDNGQVQGLLQGTADLKPETGDVLTAGIVYEPSWFNGFSFNVDYWKYKLDDVITAVDVSTASNICVSTQDPQFCGYFSRGPFGDILAVQQPTINLGKLETSGYDFGVRYQLRDTAAGSFQFTVDATYIDKYDSTPCDVCDTVEVAGTYNRQYGNYAQWRGLASIGWGFDPFTALLSMRYIDSLVVVDPDGAPGIQPDLKVPSKTYLDFTLGYTFWEKLTVTVGVDNLTDEQPPILYQNNVTNANTDVSTYDTIGTYYRAGIRYKF